MKQNLNPIAIIAILVVVLGALFGVLYKMTEAPVSDKPQGMGSDPGVRVGTRPEDQPPPKVIPKPAGETKPAAPDKKPAKSTEATNK